MRRVRLSNPLNSRWLGPVCPQCSSHPRRPRLWLAVQSRQASTSVAKRVLKLQDGPQQSKKLSGSAKSNRDSTAGTLNGSPDQTSGRAPGEASIGKDPNWNTASLENQPKANESPETSIPLDASSKLSKISSQLPTHSLRRVMTSYLALSKPRLTFLIVLTATSAYSLYPVPTLLLPSVTSTPSLSALTLLYLTTGTALASASANTLNMLLEPEHDAKMTRTRNRPLVRRLIRPRAALLFAIATGVIGVGSLYVGTNTTVAGLGLFNIFLYAGVYTPLKRISVLNTWVGAVVGAIPPLMGWTAAAGQSASGAGTWQELLFGEGSAGGWLLAGLVYAWQFPHFNALSHIIKDEYRNAGYRMLAWVNPAMNGRVAFRYAILMFPICGGLCWAGVTDWGYVLTSSVVNGWVARDAWRFWRRAGAGGSARGLFWACIWHLPGVMVLAMVHKKGLWEGLWKSTVERIEDGEDELEEVEAEVEVEKVPSTAVG